jgi:PIN domain nuclease of toxin-antitoxin system
MILLDTHVVFWLALDPERISKSALAAIRRQRKATGKPAISCVSLYEIARMSERKRILLDVPLETFLDRVNSLFEVRPISMAVAVTAARLPDEFPGDPADRLIVATAIVEGLSLVTADRHIRRSRSVKTIW